MVRLYVGKLLLHSYIPQCLLRHYDWQVHHDDLKKYISTTSTYFTLITTQLVVHWQPNSSNIPSYSSTYYFNFPQGKDNQAQTTMSGIPIPFIPICFQCGTDQNPCHCKVVGPTLGFLATIVAAVRTASLTYLPSVSIPQSKPHD